MPEGFAKRHISDAENRLRLLLCIDALGLCTREELWPFVAKLELMEYMPMCLYLDDLLRDGSLMEGQYADVKAPVLGPAAAQVVKVMGRYRYHLTMRARDSARFRSLVSGVLREFMLDSRNRGVTVFADSNPDL